MRKVELEDPRRIHQAREALRLIERQREVQNGTALSPGTARMATPGKATLTGALGAATLEPESQLSRTLMGAASDVANLEQANRSGNFDRASWARTSIVRFLDQLPWLLAAVSHDAKLAVATQVQEILARAEVALDNAPKISQAARQAADRGDFSLWHADLAPWHAKARASAHDGTASAHDGAAGSHAVAASSHAVAASSHEAATSSHAVAASSHEVAVGSHDAAAGAHDVAAQGVVGGGDALPHAEVIGRSFGPEFDVRGLRAHVGGAAARAADALGAEAYATGSHIAFARAPDVHTAAHEAAHAVLQQRGIAPAGGIGTHGDAFERHADAVADAVVAGRSAAPLLAQMARGATVTRAARGTAVVQMKEKDARVTARGLHYLNVYGSDLAILLRNNVPAVTPPKGMVWKGDFGRAFGKRLDSYLLDTDAPGFRSVFRPADLYEIVGEVVIANKLQSIATTLEEVFRAVNPHYQALVPEAFDRVAERYAALAPLDSTKITRAMLTPAGNLEVLVAGTLVYDNVLGWPTLDVEGETITAPADPKRLKARVAKHEAREVRERKARGDASMNRQALAEKLSATLAKLQTAAEQTSLWNEYVFGGKDDPRLWTHNQIDNIYGISDATLLTRGPLIDEQASVVSRAADGIAQLSASYQPPTHPDDAGPQNKHVAMVRETYRLYANALNRAHLGTGGTELANAQRAHRMLATNLLAIQVADAGSATREYIAQKPKPTHPGEEPAHEAQKQKFEDENLLLSAQQQAAMGEATKPGVDADFLRSISVRTGERALAHRMASLEARLHELKAELDKYAPDKDEAEWAKFAGNTRVQKLAALKTKSDKLVVKCREIAGRVTESQQAAEWERLGYDVTPENEQAYRERRTAVVTEGNNDLATFVETEDLATYFREAYEAVESERTRELIRNIVTLLVVGLVTGQIAAGAGALVQGLRVWRIGRTILSGERLASIAGGAVGVTVDAGLMSAAQTELMGGSLMGNFGENFVSNALVLAALRPFASMQGDAAAVNRQLDDFAKGLEVEWTASTVGSTGRKAVQVAGGTAILSMEMVAGAAVSFAHQQMTKGQPTSDEQMIAWIQQGAGMAFGKFMGHRLHGFETRLRHYGNELGAKLTGRLKEARALASLMEQGKVHNPTELIEITRTLLGEEAAFIQRAKASGPLPKDLAAAESEHETHAAAMSVERTAMLQWQGRGLRPLSQDATLWLGTPEQIKDAIADAGPAANPKYEADGRVRLQLGGQEIVLAPNWARSARVAAQGGKGAGKSGGDHPSGSRRVEGARLEELRAGLSDEVRDLPIHEVENLRGKDAQVRYRDGEIVLEVGPDAAARQVRYHAATAKALLKYRGPLGRIRILLEDILTKLRIMPGHGTAGFEARLEVKKLRAIEADVMRLRDALQKGVQLIENGRAVTEQELAAELRSVDEQITFHQARLRSFDTGTGVVAAKGNEDRPVYAVRIADVDNDDKIQVRGSIDRPEGISISFNGPDVRGREPFLGTAEIKRNDNGEVVHTMALDTRITLDGVTYGIKMFPDVANPDGIPTGVGDPISFTKFALDRAMQKYRDLGHGDVDVLGGSLADDNKANFQLEYAAAIQAGLDHDAALQQAARSISFGKHRMEVGYTDLVVKATGSEELRDVLSQGGTLGDVTTKDGRKISNFDILVPTSIEIDARKPTPSTTKL